MQSEPFTFTYCEQQYEALAESVPSADRYRRFRLAFPNVQSIVEGSMHVTETAHGEWLIERFMSMHPVPEEFLRGVYVGFVEFIDDEKT